MPQTAHAAAHVAELLPPPLSARMRSLWFWALHTAGWLGFVASSTLASWMVGAGWSGLTPALAAGAVGFLLTAAFRRVLRSRWAGRRLAPTVAACWLSGSLALGMTYSAVNAMLIDKPEFVADARLHAAIVLSRSFVVMSWLGLYLGIRYRLQTHEQNRRMLAAAAMAHEAQLKMLRFQIDPHFLFNTLNAISTLVREGDNAAAAAMVQKLAAFFRRSLEAEPAHRLRLGEEIAAAQLYLDIERVRFGDRLSVRIALPADCGDALVPGMILQPLLENAVKHGVAHSPGPGLIGIAAERRGDRLRLRVSDSGPGFADRDDASAGAAPGLAGAQDDGGGASSARSLGVGLRNTRARLDVLYGEEASLRLGTSAEGGAEVAIDLPLEFAESAAEPAHGR